MAPAGIGNSLEGLHAVAAAAAAGRVRVLHVEASRAAEVNEVVALVEAGGGSIRTVADLAALATTSAPQGLVAEATPIPTVDIKQLAEGDRAPAVVVLDHLEDPRNVGAVARSAQAAGFTGLVVASRRAAPLSASAFKAAAGALETLPVAIVSSIPKALETLKKAGLWIVGLDADGDRSVFDIDLLTEPVAIVVGAEGSGLSRLSRQIADVVAEIPMAGQMESLNASAAATLACFEVARSRGWVT